jgi:ABC-type transport system substrate-binding protein
MRLRVLLTVVPVTVIALLWQSYFWVPTYDRQGGANPERLRKFIEASIGDAKILNPILNADTASSRIAGLVFDGLLDLDEDLSLRGRLARAWRVEEYADLLLPRGATLAGGEAATPALVQERLGQLVAGDPVLRERVTSIELIAATEREQALEIAGQDGARKEARVRVRVPARARIHLGEVDQDLRARLDPLLGPDYGAAFRPAEHVSVEPPELEQSVLSEHPELLTLLSHHPVITFELRRDVRFHDGHPFDAGDVQFTYRSIMDPASLSPRTSDFEPIERIETPDAHTVRVVYKRLFSPAVNAWTMGILPEHLLDPAAMEREKEERELSQTAREAFGMRDSRFNRNPVGTGPFRFRGWQTDEVIELHRNDDYWDRPPEYAKYYFRVMPEPLAQEVEFRAGAIDAYAPQPHQAARYRDDPRYRTFSAPGLGYTYIGYNNRRPLFSDSRVRRALGMAIDIDAIIAYVLYGQGEGTTGPYPRTTEWYDPNVAPLPHDPEGAARLLEQAGWHRNADGWLEKDGKVFEFTLISNNGNLLRKAVLTIAQNSWRQLGVKCSTQVFEWAVFLQDFINPGDFDAVVLGWQMGADPDLFQLWHSSQTGENQLNFVGYRSAEADAVIERIRREYDRPEQVRLARSLHALITRDQPYTFLYAPLATRVLDRKIVMVEDDGRIVPVRASRSGDVFFHMNRWHKLEAVPAF